MYCEYIIKRLEQSPTLKDSPPYRVAETTARMKTQFRPAWYYRNLVCELSKTSIANLEVFKIAKEAATQRFYRENRDNNEYRTDDSIR